MHFLLDQDVSAVLRTTITELGHECETASTIGMSDAADDQLVIAASDRKWILITHDKELGRKLTKRPIGRVIILRCAEWDAPMTFENNFPDFGPSLDRYQDLLVVVQPDGYRLKHGWKGWVPGDGH